MTRADRHRVWLDIEAALQRHDVPAAARDEAREAVLGQAGRSLDSVDMHRIVNAAVNAAGGQAPFARRAGVKPPHLNMMLGWLRPIGDGVLRAAGLRRVVVERFEFTDTLAAQAREVGHAQAA